MMVEFDHDPGKINGCIVIKKSKPQYEEYIVISRYEWEEEENDGWVGIQRRQIPVYETQKVLIGHECIWQVFTEDENNRSKSIYNGDLFSIQTFVYFFTNNQQDRYFYLHKNLLY